MKVLVVSPVLVSAEHYVIPEIRTIKETMIYNLCLGFVANGHQVTLAAAAEFKPLQEEHGYACEVIFFKSALTGLFHPTILPLSFEFYKYLKTHHQSFDLVVSSEVFTFSSLFASLVCPSKTVIWQEMMYHQQKFKKLPSKFWHRVIIPLFMRRIKCVIPRSEKARIFIGKYMQRVSFESVEHGINISLFEFSRVKKRQLICSSQLIYRKNVESIITIYSRLIQVKGYEDIKLMIAGRGVYRPVLETLVAQLGLQDQVSFLGFLNHKDLNNMIKESYTFLINTRQDLNMISVPESIVSGTPVIINLIPASADYISNEKLGIAKDNWDEKDIIEIIENNPVYVDHCINYRDKLTSSYSAQRIIEIQRSFMQ